MTQSGFDKHVERITTLEDLVANQSKTIEELSATIARQWDEFDMAKRKLDALTQRFLDLEEATAPGIETTKPPHF